MEEHGKSRHTIWLPDETWNRVKLLYKEDNCFSQSEFVEKAIRFYDGYLHTAKSSDFLPKVLLEVLEGTLGVYGDRRKTCVTVSKEKQNLFLAIPPSLWYVCWLQIGGDPNGKTKTSR